jgi:cytoskeleton protein RodZ
MTAIGETLRRARVGRNLELQQISRELKISSRFLDAIEREAFDELPGSIFVKSFVRQYAKFLGLDEDELAAAAQRIVEPVEEEAATKNHSMAPVDNLRVPPMRAWGSVGDGSRFGWSSAMPALGLVVVATLVCSGIYVWWQRERGPAAISTPRTAASTRQTPPSASPAAAAPTAPAPLDTSQTPTVQAAPSTEARPANADGGQSAGPPANAAQTAPATQTPAAGPPAAVKTASAPKGPVHVEVTALTTTWVRARSDGKYVFSATLDASQTRTVEANESVELLLGDAAGVSIVLNGKPVGTVGPKGQVRTVQLSSGGFKIVSAKAPAPSDPL